VIYVSKTVPVNEGDALPLDRDQVWEGLVQKASNALPFVPAMTHCQVLQRLDDLSFDREIELRGQRLVERVVMEPKVRVSFTRIAGGVLGVIANEIEEDDAGRLGLRFSYALVLKGVAPASAEERAYADGMAGDYLAALQATLDAMRRVASGEAVRR
jgi:hypothetical protein